MYWSECSMVRAYLHFILFYNIHIYVTLCVFKNEINNTKKKEEESLWGSGKRAEL